MLTDSSVELHAALAVLRGVDDPPPPCLHPHPAQITTTVADVRVPVASVRYPAVAARPADTDVAPPSLPRAPSRSLSRSRSVSKGGGGGGAAGGGGGGGGRGRGATTSSRGRSAAADRHAQRDVERAFAACTPPESLPAAGEAAAWAAVEAVTTAVLSPPADAVGDAPATSSAPAPPAASAAPDAGPDGDGVGPLPAAPRPASRSTSRKGKLDTKVVAFELPAAGEWVFETDSSPRRDIVPAGEGLLSAELAAAQARNVLRMTIFLPNRKAMKLTVPLSATVDDVIQATLKAHKAAEVQPPLVVYTSRAFELRLHEMDGYPDEDVPALDRNRKIRGFAQGNDHEYCLCELPGAAELAAQAGGGPEIRVRMPLPFRPSPAVVKLQPPTMTVRELLDVLVQRYRLPLWVGFQHFVVRLSASDAERLKLVSQDLPLTTPVGDLGVEEVELVRRAFADVPSPDATAASSGSSAAAAAGAGAPLGASAADTASATASGGGASDTDASTAPPSGATDRTAPVQLAQAGPHGFMHTIVSAAKYDEWKVIKVNKRGRRQERLMGIDLTRITNKKVEKRRFGSNETYRAERLVSDIVTVEVPDVNGKVFFISYRESAVEEVTVEYEAMSSTDRAAIVYKLEFILGLEDKARLVIKGRR